LYVKPLLWQLRLFTVSPAGLTYCAVGALSFINDYDGVSRGELPEPAGMSFVDCARWIVHRQTTVLEEEESENEDQQTPQLTQSEEIALPSSPLGSPHATQFQADSVLPPKDVSNQEAQLPTPQPLNISEESLQWAGFNGRVNKIADTCYCFWNTGALAVSRIQPSLYVESGRLIRSTDDR
jgi:geranylgeranyl transferase type-1 subunit beta